MTISVVIADDEPLVRSGIAMLLRAEPDLEVVAEVSDGLEAVELARSHDVDIIVMDVRMPGMDGVAATRRVVEEAATRGSATKVLVLTTFNDDEAVYEALRAGASGFLLKHAAPQDLMAAVRKIAGGENWLDPAVAGKVMAAVASLPRGSDDQSLVVLERLTAREREVLTLMAQGMSNADIKKLLTLSEATVKTHVSRILMKIGCHTRAQAVALAYQSGLATTRPSRPPSG